MQQELRTIHCYDVVSFVIEVEKAVKEGFSLDLVTPQNYPQQIGYQYIATMIKDETTVEKLTLKIATEDVQKIVDDALATVQKAQEASELEKVVQSTGEELKAVVDASKKAGRPAKAK